MKFAKKLKARRIGPKGTSLENALHADMFKVGDTFKHVRNAMLKNLPILK